MNRDGGVKIMGIINVTPDSFYDGGKYTDIDAAYDHAMGMISHGVDYIDIGGESTRPGAKFISIQEEIDRVSPLVERLAKQFPSISVDTTKSEVADEALKLGATMVNDISGMNFDLSMPRIVAKHEASVVLMHIKGTPESMQKNVEYDNLLDEIRFYLDNSIKRAIEAGISKDKIVVDPGIGFGKTIDDNYDIIKNLDKICDMGYPVLIGLSRKSLIGNLFENDEDRLPATIALNAVAISKGASIIRVHDVLEHSLIVKSMNFLNKEA